MKSKTTLLLSVIGLALTTGVLTGCNTKKTKFEISISARHMTSEISMLEIWKAEYEKLHPNVNIKISDWGDSQGTSESYISKNALNRDYLTNIIYTTDDSTANLAQKKNFVDLRKYYEADPETDYSKYYSTMLDLTSFYGEFRPTTTYNGSYECEKSDDAQYGVYFAPREYNMPGLMCNVTLFKNYIATEEEKANWNKDSLKNIWLRIGESDTWNWSTFIKGLYKISDICEENQELNGRNDLGFRACEMNHTWEPVYTSIMKELGGNGIFKTDPYTFEVVQNLDSEENKAAYQTIVDTFGKNSVHKYSVDTDYGNNNFSLRTIFSSIVSYPEIGNFYDSFKRVGYEIGTINLPCEYVAAGCGGYGILVDKADKVQKLSSGESAKTVDLCWDFLKYIISKDGQNIAGKEGYIQPVLKELMDEGDWVNAYDGKIDHSAFATAKELKLDTYCFADPKKRNKLREAVGSIFFRDLFDPKTESYVGILGNCINEVNKILASK